ncbi:uncharacterized protein BDW70DRAFT_164616 [Aspergillus foveolatus]|uniref:uncharacterized protein n=1 Tax=Aspergillus foveolatus TaxID=210207 RepID=UPI003CCE0B22
MGEAATFCAFNVNPQPGENALVGTPGPGAIWIASPASPENPVPVGAVGEFLVEGHHLARGYLDKTCQRPEVGFLEHTPKWIAEMHPDRAQSKVYRSGDLGRYHADGKIEHTGRKDTVLKLNGCRNEPVEVENVLRKSLSAGDNVVVGILDYMDENEDPRLTAFVYLADCPSGLFEEVNEGDGAHAIRFHIMTNSPSTSAKVDAMKETALSTLPLHMAPSLFLLADRIPHTKSNKVDRRRLVHFGQWHFRSLRAGVVASHSY